MYSAHEIPNSEIGVSLNQRRKALFLVIATASVRLPCSCFSWYLDLQYRKYIPLRIHCRHLNMWTEVFARDLRNAFGDRTLSLISEVHVWHLDLTRLLLTTNGRWYFASLNNGHNYTIRNRRNLGRATTKKEPALTCIRIPSHSSWLMSSEWRTSTIEPKSGALLETP